MNKNIHTLGLLVGATLAFYAGRQSVPTQAQFQQESNLHSTSLITSRASLLPSQAGGESTHAPHSRLEDIATMGMRKAVEAALRESDPIAQNRMVAELLGNLTQDNAKEAVEAIRTLGMRSATSVYLAGLFNSAWGRLDGPSAIAHAQNTQSGHNGGSAIRTALSGWATADPQAAKAWVADQDAPEMEQMMLQSGLINGLARQDAIEATAYVEALEAPSEMKSHLLGPLVNEMAKRDIVEATEWAQSFSDEALIADALEGLAHRFVQQDPIKAAEWVGNQANDSHAANAIAKVANEWAEQDPKAATQWAFSLEGDAQSQAVAASFRERAESDPTAASEYLVETEGSPAKDSAINGFTDRLAFEDPKAAVTWATTIEDPALRSVALADAASNWMHQDQASASEWLEASDLPSELVESIMQF